MDILVSTVIMIVSVTGVTRWIVTTKQDNVDAPKIGKASCVTVSVKEGSGVRIVKMFATVKIMLPVIMKVESVYVNQAGQVECAIKSVSVISLATVAPRNAHFVLMPIQVVIILLVSVCVFLDIQDILVLKLAHLACGDKTVVKSVAVKMEENAIPLREDVLVCQAGREQTAPLLVPLGHLVLAAARSVIVLIRESAVVTTEFVVVPRVGLVFDVLKCVKKDFMETTV